jgi:hypothetical protein
MLQESDKHKIVITQRIKDVMVLLQSEEKAKGLENLIVEIIRAS